MAGPGGPRRLRPAHGGRVDGARRPRRLRVRRREAPALRRQRDEGAAVEGVGSARADAPGRRVQAVDVAQPRPRPLPRRVLGRPNVEGAGAEPRARRIERPVPHHGGGRLGAHLQGREGVLLPRGRGEPAVAGPGGPRRLRPAHGGRVDGARRPRRLRVRRREAPALRRQRDEGAAVEG